MKANADDMIRAMKMASRPQAMQDDMVGAGRMGATPQVGPALRDALRKSQTDFVMGAVGPTKGVLSNKELEMFERSLPADPEVLSLRQRIENAQLAQEMAESQGPRMVDGSPLPEGMVPGITRTMEFRDVNQNGIEDRDEGLYLPRDLVPESSLPPRMNYPDAFTATPEGFGMPGSVSEEEMAILEQAETSEDPEELEGLLAFAEKIRAQKQAPLSELAQELAALGGGEDTALAHVRPGEIVLPPEFMEDPVLESLLEKKFNEFDLNPEEAVVGVGIASLNPSTGLEQFGFFKKIGKKLKKVVKKVAPVAAFIPGVGTALGGVLGGIGGLATKGLAKVGLGGLGSALGKAGTFLSSKVASAGIPGLSQIAGGTGAGFGGIKAGLGSLEGLLGKGPLSGFLGGQQQTVDEIASSVPGAKTRVERLRAEGMSDAQIMENLVQSGYAQPQSSGNFNFGRAILGGEGRTPQSIKAIEDIIKGQYTPGAGGAGGAGGGGLGNLLKVGGIGALAAGLGKLAYDEAKGQTGVDLTPVTTMDAAGRYNIEAEIARRMGQQAPNPTEFGLLPANTLPELSGGQPRAMMMGGSVTPMAYAEGGNVAMEDFERMNGRIDGPGTETSDDIPAMLSDGEFVMTGQAVRGAGSYNMQDDGGILTLTPNGSPDRENGTELMYQLMEAFSRQARPRA
jgi:hypothetical protein